jgi:hypothetical protein
MSTQSERNHGGTEAHISSASNSTQLLSVMTDAEKEAAARFNETTGDYDDDRNH